MVLSGWNATAAGYREARLSFAPRGPRRDEFFRHNALGQADSHLTPHTRNFALGQTKKARQAAYRRLFRADLDEVALKVIRLALNQNQPLGDSRFHAQIERKTGERREARPRGRPRLER